MLHFFAAGSAAVQKALERVCPKCGLKQKVATSKLKETAACKKCGAPLPAKKTS